MTVDRLSPTEANPAAGGNDGASTFDEVAEEIAGLWNRVPVTLTQTGGTNTITATADPTIATLAAGMHFVMLPSATTTGAATINPDGKGALTVLRRDGSATQAGDIISGTWAQLYYDGTDLFLLNEPGPLRSTLNIAIFAYRQTDGTSGGASSADAYRTYPLNHEILNQIAGASIDTGTGIVTLPAGQYYLEAAAVLQDCDGGFLGLYNEDAADFIAAYASVQSWSAAATEHAHVATRGYLNLASETDISLAYRVDTTDGTNGLGLAVEGDQPEQYGYLVVQRILPASAAAMEVAKLGINTGPSDANKLQVYSAAALFDGITATDGGDGDFRAKINKEATGDVASLIWQVGYSGRAEIGLTGDDDLTIKTSPDGSAFTDAVVIDKDTGEVTIKVKLASEGPVGLAAYAVAGLPTAADHTGAMIYVSDETGGAVPAFSDGSDWRRVTDRAVVS